MKLLPGLTAALMICAAPALAQGVPLTGAVNQQIADSPRCEVEVPKNPISDAQRQKLHALRDQFILDTAQTKAQLRVSEDQLHELLSASTIDKSAALSLQSKINSLRGSLADAHLKLKLAMTDVFTPEQRAEMHKWHHGHGRWGKHGCGHERGCPGDGGECHEGGPHGPRAFGPPPMPGMFFGFGPSPIMMPMGPDLVFEPGMDFNGAPPQMWHELDSDAPVLDSTP